MPSSPLPGRSNALASAPAGRRVSMWLRRLRRGPESDRPAPARRPLAYEVLEDRTVPAGYVPLAPTTDLAWATGYFTPAGTADLNGGAAAAPDPAAGEAATYPAVPVNAAGLPLLESRPNGAGLELFMDFAWDDGYHRPYSTDADRGSYNFSEQRDIYNAWRDIVSAFSFLDVNVTTVLPYNNENFCWIPATNEFTSGGEAGQPGIGQGRSGWVGDSFAREGELPGYIHEFGHNLGLWHNADYDYAGNEVHEYTNSYGGLDRTFMGGAFWGVGSKYRFHFARTSEGPWAVQDQILTALQNIAGTVGGDGFRPDDYGGDFGSAFDLGDGAGSVQRDGYVERPWDNDLFKVTPAASGRWQFTANPLYMSAARPVIRLEDAAGTVLAEGQAYGGGGANFGAGFAADLQAGQTYYARVFWDGDYSSLGYYNLAVSPLPTNFRTTTVGNPPQPGSAAYDPAAGTLTHLGGGSDTWQKYDGEQFTYAALTGEGRVTARVDGLDNTGVFAKAGVEIRQSSHPDSPRVYVGLKPDGSIEAIARTAYGADAFNPALSAEALAGRWSWFRIERFGNGYFDFMVSADGVNWLFAGNVYAPMPDAVMAGVTSSAFSNRLLAAATFGNVSAEAVTRFGPGGAVGDAPPAYNALPAPTGVVAAPAPEQSTDVVVSWAAAPGARGYGVERSDNGADWRWVANIGADATTYRDAGVGYSKRWFYRVHTLGADNPWSAPSAPADVVNKPAAPGMTWGYTSPDVSWSDSEIFINWLDTHGEAGYRIDVSTDGVNYAFGQFAGANATFANFGGLQPGRNYWFRVTPLSPQGDGVAAVITSQTRLGSRDGAGVVAVGGLRFTGRRPTAMMIAWDDVAVEAGYRVERSIDGVNWSFLGDAARDVTTWTDADVTPGGEYYYRVLPFNEFGAGAWATVLAAAPAAGLPRGWANADVGGVGGAGAAVNTGPGAWTVVGGGADIWDTADQFQFAYQALTGDVTIVARVAGVEGTNPFAKAGVMIRSGLAANATHAMMGVTPAGRAEFLRRPAAGAYSDVTADPGVSAPYWVKLVRQGSAFRAYDSANGVTWRLVGADVIPMGQTVYAGLVVTSHDNGRLNTAAFTNVKVTAAPRPLPRPWRDADVGSPGQAGSAGYVGGAFTVAGGGADVWGAADQFHYVYQKHSGNFQVVARLGAQAATDPSAKAGLMIRGGLGDGSPYAFQYFAPSQGVAFETRRAPSAFANHLADAPGAAKPAWLKLVRVGDSLSGYASADGRSWALLGTDRVSMGATVYVGLAVTAHNNELLSAAAFDHVSVGAPRYDAARAVDSGGGAAGRFQADAAADGGEASAVGAPVDASGVVNPAPQAVYQSERRGQFSYHIPGLQPGATYAVRLHFAETLYADQSQRRFHVAINGRRALSDFDIVAAAGGPNRAVVRTFFAVADADGRVTVDYLSGSAGNPTASGVEVVRAGAAAVRVARSGLVLNRQTGLSVGALTLTNTASAALTGSVVVVLRGLPRGVELANAAGVTADGKPYLVVDVSKLARGKSVRVAVEFRNPARVPVNYVAAVYAARLTA